MKRIIMLFFSLVIMFSLNAQKHRQITDKDTLVYGINQSNRLASSRLFADHYLAIMPADTSSGKKVYPVIEYYLSMKIKMVSYSLSQKYDSLIFEGPYVDYYPDGKNKSVEQYSNGIIYGRVTNYYPNGKLYTDEYVDKAGKRLLINCQDSLGNMLAKDGNGSWVSYSPDFRYITGKGIVKDSLEEGKWYEDIENKDDSTVYSRGKVVSSTSKCRQLGVCLNPQKTAIFQGDFGMYLARSIRYPAEAKEKNQQGKVFIQFIVDKDGSPVYVHVLKSSGSKSIDAEAMRVINASPKWKPAILNNDPVSSLYTVPISFTLHREDF